MCLHRALRSLSAVSSMAAGGAKGDGKGKGVGATGGSRCRAWLGCSACADPSTGRVPWVWRSTGVSDCRFCGREFDLHFWATDNDLGDGGKGAKGGRGGGGGVRGGVRGARGAARPAPGDVKGGGKAKGGKGGFNHNVADWPPLPQPTFVGLQPWAAGPLAPRDRSLGRCRRRRRRRPRTRSRSRRRAPAAGCGTCRREAPGAGPRPGAAAHRQPAGGGAPRGPRPPRGGA